MPPLFRLLLLLLPFIEIASLILVGDLVGVGWTLLAVAAAMALGVAVIKVLGRASLAEVRAALARQEPPVEAMLSGAAALAAGILLIIPGFVSDIVALVLLLPGLRLYLGGLLWRRLGPDRPGASRSGASRSGASGPGASGPGASGPGAAGGARVIDGEFHEVGAPPAGRIPPDPGKPDRKETS